MKFWAAQAWVGGEWAHDVLLDVASDGRWAAVTPDVPLAESSGAQALAGPVIPGIVNAHSHAFQRAMAGLAERQGGVGSAGDAADDFWSWRDRMYTAANRITPGQLEAIATQLYVELLASGYTQVCEFHYLHNDLDGKPYADPAEMALALVRAASHTGIGLTLLPTLYMRSGFQASGLRQDQRRFASTPDQILRQLESIRRQTSGNTLISCGVALHSLRAVDPGALHELTTAVHDSACPVHIHISEQTQEVEDCVAHTGQRPIEWLLAHAPVDARWNLVHATHANAAELARVERSSASIVICPTTEANLGDGVFDFQGYSAAGGSWSIGSDSHVCRQWSEELRLLEYSQRLTRRQRNIAARSSRRLSSAAALFEGALRGGPAASGVSLAGLAAGQRGDFAVLDAGSDALLGIPASHLLDAMIFSSPDSHCREVYVAGQRVANMQVDAGKRKIRESFHAAMRALWADAPDRGGR
ncbi:MAG: formimidoylglutamate deiminase [Pseudomonadota bacterium]